MRRAFGGAALEFMRGVVTAQDTLARGDGPSLQATKFATRVSCLSKLHDYIMKSQRAIMLYVCVVLYRWQNVRTVDASEILESVPDYLPT